MADQVSAIPENLELFSRVAGEISDDLKLHAVRLEAAQGEFERSCDQSILSTPLPDVGTSARRLAQDLRVLAEDVGRTARAFKEADTTPMPEAVPMDAAALQYQLDSQPVPDAVWRELEHADPADIRHMWTKLDNPTRAKLLRDHPELFDVLAVIPEPGPRPTPPPKDGSKEPWDSERLYSRGDDLAFREVMVNAAATAEVLGMTNAAKHMRHYLNNTGEPLEVDPELIERDVPRFKEHVEGQANREATAAAQKALAEGRYGEPIPFVGNWEQFTIGLSMSKNWYFAVAACHTAATGYVVLQPGDPPQVSVTYQTRLVDRYNWDTGKEAPIIGKESPDNPTNIEDEWVGNLHRAGLAREYDMHGTSQTHTMTITLPPGGQPNSTPPAGQGADARDETRADPGRSQEVGGSRISGGGQPR